MMYLCTSLSINGTPVSIQGITDACDDKQNELEGILVLANEMHEYGVSEEASQKIDEDMDQLKEGWVRLCEKLECPHRSQPDSRMVEGVPRGTGYAHIRTYIHTYFGTPL